MIDLSFTSLLVGVLIFVVVQIGLWIHRNAAWKLDMPGPNFTLFFGHLFETMRESERFYDWANENNEKYKEHGIWYHSLPGYPPDVYMTDPKLVEHVFVTQFQKYLNAPKDSLAAEISADLFGEGIFHSDGPEWRRQRKLFSYMFSHKMLRDTMFPTFLTCGNKMLERLGKFADSRESLDIQDTFARATFDGICSIAFGQDVGCLSADETPVIATAFDKVQSVLADRAMDPTWRIKRFLNISFERTFNEQMKIMEDFIQDIVTKTRSGNYDSSRLNIIKLCLDMAGDDGVSDKFLRDLVFSFCIAGRDTTACALSWTMYELCRNPDVMKKVVEEVDSLEEVSYGTVSRSLPYTEAVFFESQRLHPSVPNDSQECVEDDILPNGVKVTKGLRMNFQPYGFGRSTDIWGPDASEFKPERFIGGDMQYGQFKFPHFKGGPRLCLGKTMAVLEAKTFLAQILRSYEISLVNEEPAQYLITVLLWIKDGLPVKVKKRC